MIPQCNKLFILGTLLVFQVSDLLLPYTSETKTIALMHYLYVHDV